ncbi:MAG: DUF721 domain-containing protein [Actinobacteria bacterium]|nr:DUF721 domain-containing protein [Actinomycetota bacterium]
MTCCPSSTPTAGGCCSTPWWGRASASSPPPIPRRHRPRPNAAHGCSRCGRVSLPPRRHRDLVGVGELLGRATRKFARPGDSVLASVRAAWPEATGPGTVNHAYPIRRSRVGVVTIACADAVWAQELEARAEQLEEILTGIIGDPSAVAGLRFVIADHALPAAGPEPPRRGPLPPPDPSAMKRAEAVTRDIEDPALREVVTRAAARALERDKTSQ